LKGLVNQVNQKDTSGLKRVNGVVSSCTWQVFFFLFWWRFTFKLVPYQISSCYLACGKPMVNVSQ
jgi:hypothetical protein